MSTYKTLNFTGRRTTPVILQTEAAECGLASLTMVSAYHGFDTDLASLRRQFSISMKGATLNDLIRIATHLNLATRPIKAELSDLSKMTLPAILHWDFNHFVVLSQANERRMVIHDPARGKRIMTMDEVSGHFTGVAMELAPTQEFQPRRERQKIRFGQLLGGLPGLKGTIAQIFVLAVVLEVLSVLAPFFMQLIVDHAIVAEDRDLVVVLGVGFLLLGLVQTGVTALRSWVVVVLGTTLNLRLFGNLFRRLLNLPMAFFEKRHLGDVVSRFESLEAIQRTLTTSVVEAIVDGIMAVITLVMMCVYGWQLALVVCGAALLYGVLRLALYRPLRQTQEEQILRAAKQQSNFIESVRGIQSVKLFNRQLYRQTLYQNLLVDNFNTGIRIQKLNILFRGLNGALFTIENIAVVWLGALMVLDGAFSVGMLFAFMSYKQQFITRIVSFIEKGIDLKMLSLHSERVADIALTEPEQNTPVFMELMEENNIPAEIEVRNLSFRYSESEPWILKNINFRIEAGESVAIIGPSGCGKTTLLKVLLGLLPPNDGEVLVGGSPLDKFGLSRYREMLGTVMQEDQLFAGSIADNICFFDPSPAAEKIQACAAIAAVHDDIERMPMRYNTLIGDMGTILSGGQKQRVLLARALYKNPQILFLDEATSHLDVNREKSVNDAIRRLNLTRIIVAHRQETIASADRVIVLGEEVQQLVIKRAAC